MKFLNLIFYSASLLLLPISLQANECNDDLLLTQVTEQLGHPANVIDPDYRKMFGKTVEVRTVSVDEMGDFVLQLYPALISKKVRLKVTPPRFTGEAFQDEKFDLNLLMLHTLALNKQKEIGLVGLKYAGKWHFAPLITGESGRVPMRPILSAVDDLVQSIIPKNVESPSVGILLFHTHPSEHAFNGADAEASTFIYNWIETELKIKLTEKYSGVLTATQWELNKEIGFVWQEP